MAELTVVQFNTYTQIDIHIDNGIRITKEKKYEPSTHYRTVTNYLFIKACKSDQ